MNARGSVDNNQEKQRFATKIKDRFFRHAIENKAKAFERKISKTQVQNTNEGSVSPKMVDYGNTD
jgi:hypothetical protein